VRRDNYTDTPLPPEFPAGRNPPDGAIIDYVIGADAAGPVTLEIFTAAHTLVRHFSSADAPELLDEKNFNVPMYWARPPLVLSAAKGMHRFVWDLRYPTPGVMERDFPISAIYRDTPREPLGVLALPAVYTVTLTVNGRGYTQPLTLKMDPRAAVTAPGLSEQFRLATKLADMMNQSFAAISAAPNPAASASSPAASPKPPAPDLRADLIALNADLATAYDVIEGADRAPTTQGTKAVTHLAARLAALLKGQR
jgi:hypothetical protein